MGVIWCSVCGGTHNTPRECPGDLRATGPERHGWRIAVDTPYGIESYGVLVAPSDDLWRSRIVTFPNILWTVPGGRTALKFAAKSPQDAEALAIQFIEAHVKARGYQQRDLPDAPQVGRLQTESEAEARIMAAAMPALRKLRAVPVRFGNGPALFQAMTGNLSESGLFVVTMAPFNKGTDVRLLLDLATGPVGLHGRVVWQRDRAVAGRPVGMGVELVAPPGPYRDFVIELP